MAAYRVKLIFLRLPSVEIANARVAARGQQAGHSVPEEVIRRRFQTGWANFNHRHKPIVDAWVLYDNGGQVPELSGQGEKP